MNDRLRIASEQMASLGQSWDIDNGDLVKEALARATALIAAEAELTRKENIGRPTPRPLPPSSQP